MEDLSHLPILNIRHGSECAPRVRCKMYGIQCKSASLRRMILIGVCEYASVWDVIVYCCDGWCRALSLSCTFPAPPLSPPTPEQAPGDCGLRTAGELSTSVLLHDAYCHCLTFIYHLFWFHQLSRQVLTLIFLSTHLFVYNWWDYSFSYISALFFTCTTKKSNFDICISKLF